MELRGGSHNAEGQKFCLWWICRICCLTTGAFSALVRMAPQAQGWELAQRTGGLFFHLYAAATPHGLPHTMCSMIEGLPVDGAGQGLYCGRWRSMGVDLSWLLLLHSRVLPLECDDGSAGGRCYSDLDVAGAWRQGDVTQRRRFLLAVACALLGAADCNFITAWVWYDLATLAQIYEELYAEPDRQRAGRALLAAMDASGSRW